MKFSFDQSIIVAVAVAVLLMGLGYLSLNGIGNLVTTAHWVEHTQVVIDRLQVLLTQVDEDSMAVRGYLLTGNSVYLRSLETSRQAMPRELQDLKGLVSDNPVRLTELAKLEELMNQHLASIERFGQSGENAQPSSLARQLDESNRLTDQIRAQITLIHDEERLLLQKRAVASVESSKAVRGLIVLGLIFGILVVLGGTFLINREMAARQGVQRELDRFFTLTNDLFCIAGFDGHFKRLNPAWEKTFGYTTEELTAKPFETFLHPEDVEKTRQEFARQHRGEGVVSFENRYRCKDGSYRWLLWNAQPLVAEQLIFASARDMTERKQMEESLRQSEERARLMVESVKDYAIFMLDPDGRVVNWNPGAERIKGYRAEEIIGRHFSCFYPEKSIREGIPERELRVARDTGRSEDEGWRVRKDGSLFWANAVISAVRNSQGGLLGFVKLTRDATARMEAGERIQKLNEELRQRADLLETANKELESFSYSVSHDLRAPLRHIHGFVELLQNSPALKGDEVSHRQMGIIAAAAKVMGKLIDDLLAFSRTGRAEMHLVKIDLREMVEQTIRDLETECKGRTVKWEVKPLSRVAGDPTLLRLVWMNLLDNAVKYTGPRPVAKIEIGQVAGDAAGADEREVVFYVRDNGVGFDMKYVSKLFGVFQRLHRAEDFGGTGIGLANVQRIIHRHGGRVWAEAQVDAGATFYFSLPVTETQLV
jgi:PAS domain S-box-containing protein